jgi:energy-coupling factor transporter ATP-binding protein EcfA2
VFVAIIGYPGAGKSTLTTGLSGLLHGRSVTSFEAVRGSPGDDRPVFLDGIPQSLAELAELLAQAPGGVDHYLYLDTPLDLRISRIARMIAAGFASPASQRDRMLHPDDLDALLAHLESGAQLTTIDVGGTTRTDVLNRALDALDIGI